MAGQTSAEKTNEGGAPSADERVAELQRQLMESTDASVRAHAHLELGRAALRHGHFERAVRHFREALIHDPRLEAARQHVADLGEISDMLPGRVRGRKSAIRALLGKVRRR